MADRLVRASFDLDRLSASERVVLDLLARGHTAKSIAVVLGISEAAANERLRSARRKTGASSSRELARALAQECGHEKIGLVIAGSPTPSARSRSRWWDWSRQETAMTIAAMIATAIALGSLQEVEPSSASLLANDAGLAERLSGPQPIDLQARMAAEGRDPVWAEATDAAIKERYRQEPSAQALRELSVTCARTLCQVVGRIRPDAANADLFSLMEAVQSGTISRSMPELGLRTALSAFTQDPAGRGETVFMVFLERRP